MNRRDPSMGEATGPATIGPGDHDPASTVADDHREPVDLLTTVPDRHEDTHADPYATQATPADWSASDALLAAFHPSENSAAGRGAGLGSGRSAEFVPGYELLGELGRGGMGVVYKARQVRLNRLVALKMIRDGHAGGVQLERFRIEAEAVARLRHPNVVQIYDVGESGGLPFCALELLEGGTLAGRIAGTPLPAREAATLTATLARAVHAAHEAGIVHRDLKPANVLFDRDGTAKVTDFGLAKRLEDDGGQTATGQVLGTPSYMAPEQARGQNHAVGPPADVYALGAILYDMLTGRPPHRGTTPMETVLMVIDREPVPPSRLQPKVPRDLETICLKALQKDPARRYASAEALAGDLGRFLAGEPIRARPTPAWERGLKWARRRPTTAALSTLGTIAGVALLATALAYREASLREERRVAGVKLESLDDLGRAHTMEERGALDDARAALTGLLGRLQAEPRLVRERRRAEGLLADVRRDLAERAGREAALAARRAARAQFERFLRLRDEAIFRDIPFTGLEAADQPRSARDAARDALAVFGAAGAPPGTLTDAERAEVVAGRYQVTLILAEATARPLPGEDPARQGREALAILDRAAAARTPGKAYYLRRAACLDRAGDAAGARAARDRAGQLPPGDAFGRVLVGEERCRRQDWRGAEDEFDAALQQKPDLFWAQCLSAICYLNAFPSRPGEAKAALTACLQRHPEFPWLYLLRGLAYGEMGALSRGLAAKLAPEAAASWRAKAGDQFAAAEADYRRAQELGLEGDLLYALFMNRGVLRYQREAPAEAAADFRRAIALAPGRYNAYESLAQALHDEGRPDEAIEQLDRAIARKPDHAALYRDRATIRLEREGDLPPAALAAVLADLAEAGRREPPGSRAAADDHLRRAQLLARLGRPAEALNDADAALAIAPDLGAAYQVRALALLDLGRHEEVIRTCTSASAAGPPTAELLELRGLAHVGLGDFGGAVDDYTLALALRPGWARMHAYRGSAYLLADSPELALRDFDAVARLAPSDPDGPAGRASALARLRRPREAVAAAEAALVIGDPSPTTLHRAARVFALAAAELAPVPPRRDPLALRDSLAHEARALALLRRALDAMPPDRRAAFWRDVLARDEAFEALRHRPRFERLGAPLVPAAR